MQAVEVVPGVAVECVSDRRFDSCALVDDGIVEPCQGFVGCVLQHEVDEVLQASVEWPRHPVSDSTDNVGEKFRCALCDALPDGPQIARSVVMEINDVAGSAIQKIETHCFVPAPAGLVPRSTWSAWTWSTRPRACGG